MEKEYIENITFVTCYVKIYKNEPYQYKNAEWRTIHFESIAKTGVNICLYIDETTKPFLQYLESYPNVRLLELSTTFRETPIGSLFYKPNIVQPDIRHYEKDTIDYMALMNSKMEFISDTINKNPFKSELFAWFDFSMAYLFKEPETTMVHLKTLSQQKFIKKFAAFPGCYTEKIQSYKEITESINWRFCGSFFIGDKESLIELYNLYLEYTPKFIDETNMAVWELNMWAYFESYANWDVIWYSSDHNDILLNIPAHILFKE